MATTKLTPHRQLFNHYMSLQSKEMKSEIKGYRKMTMKGMNIAIKVIFRNGDWLHVIQKINGAVEWY